MTPIAVLEKQRASLKSNTSSIKQLVVASPDDALLEMMKNLSSDLNDLESKSRNVPKIIDGANISFESKTLPELKKAIADFGHVGHIGASVSSLALFLDLARSSSSSSPQ